MGQDEIAITGLWIRRIGDNVEALIEWQGKWLLVFQEDYRGNFSHIFETGALFRGKIDVNPDTMQDAITEN